MRPPKKVFTETAHHNNKNTETHTCTKARNSSAPQRRAAAEKHIHTHQKEECPTPQTKGGRVIEREVTVPTTEKKKGTGYRAMKNEREGGCLGLDPGDCAS